MNLRHVADGHACHKARDRTACAAGHAHSALGTGHACTMNLRHVAGGHVADKGGHVARRAAGHACRRARGRQTPAERYASACPSPSFHFPRTPNYSSSARSRPIRALTTLLKRTILLHLTVNHYHPRPFPPNHPLALLDLLLVQHIGLQRPVAAGGKRATNTARKNRLQRPCYKWGPEGKAQCDTVASLNVEGMLSHQQQYRSVGHDHPRP